MSENIHPGHAVLRRVVPDTTDRRIALNAMVLLSEEALDIETVGWILLSRAGVQEAVPFKDLELIIDFVKWI